MPRQQKQQNNAVTIPDADWKTIITGNPVESAERTDKWARELGESLANKNLTTSQIRNLFGEARRIEMHWPIDIQEANEDLNLNRRAKEAERSFKLLESKLVYTVGKESNNRKREVLKELVEALRGGMMHTRDGKRDDFQRFMDFFEATLAYHKYYGGKD